MDISNITYSMENMTLNTKQYNEEYHELIRCRNNCLIHLNNFNYNINFYYKYVFLLFSKYLEYISFDPYNEIYDNTTKKFKNLLIKIKDNLTLYIKKIFKMPISYTKLQKTFKILNEIVNFIDYSLDNTDIYINNINENEISNILNKVVIS